VYGLISAVIGTLLRLLTLPLMVITIGLFEFVINAFLLLITDWLTDWLEVDGFLSALAAAVILSVASIVISLIARVLVPNNEGS
jgi:putative membrane protein